MTKHKNVFTVFIIVGRSIDAFTAHSPRTTSADTANPPWIQLSHWGKARDGSVNKCGEPRGFQETGTDFISRVRFTWSVCRSGEKKGSRRVKFMLCIRGKRIPEAVSNTSQPFDEKSKLNSGQMVVFLQSWERVRVTVTAAVVVFVCADNWILCVLVSNSCTAGSQTSCRAQCAEETYGNRALAE